jgi:hypothetical protein
LLRTAKPIGEKVANYPPLLVAIPYERQHEPASGR